MHSNRSCGRVSLSAHHNHGGRGREVSLQFRLVLRLVSRRVPLHFTQLLLVNKVNEREGREKASHQLPVHDDVVQLQRVRFLQASQRRRSTAALTSC